MEDGVKVNGLLVKAVQFADDQAMVSSSNAGLQRIIDALNNTSNDYGIRINIKKTKVMRVYKTGGKEMKITINSQKVEQVRQFVYLGNAITEDCKCHEEVQSRIAIGKEAFSKRGGLLRGKMKLELKKRIVKTLIWSTVLYATDTWMLRKVDIQRLESYEM